MKWFKYVFLFGWLTSLYSNKDEQQNEINIQVHDDTDFECSDIIVGNSERSSDVWVSNTWDTSEDVWNTETEDMTSWNTSEDW